MQVPGPCCLALLLLVPVSSGAEDGGQTCNPLLTQAQENYRQVYAGMNCSDPRDQNMIELAKEAGCQVERHTLTTKDGYILNNYRLNCSNLCPNPKKKRLHPVLLVPGLDQTSVSWIWNLVNESLGFLLAKACLDVWLMNPRGSAYSTDHVSLSCHDPKYWDFCMDEPGKYDLPVTIDYILRKTKNNKLAVVAHSMGGAIAFATLSTLTKYNNNISVLVLLATSGAMKNSPYPGLARSQEAEPIIRCLSGPVLENDNVIRTDGAMCKQLPVFQGMCGPPEAEYLKQDTTFFNHSRLDIYAPNGPMLTTIRCYCHFAQLKLTDTSRFQMFDYGSGNQQMYNQTSPPVYNLAKVTAPAVVLAAGNDDMVGASDTRTMNSTLHNVIFYRNVTGARHKDFLLTKNPSLTYFPQVVCIIEKSFKSRKMTKDGVRSCVSD